MDLNMWNNLLFFSTVVCCIQSLMTFHIDIGPRRIHKTQSNYSKYIYYAWETTTDSSVADICNDTSVEEDFGNVRFRRSITSWSNRESKITTEATEEEIDLSILSEEFLNCTHVTVEPECYSKLRNGSVFVPLYNMIFDRSNYIINERLLFVCPSFFIRLVEKFSSNIEIVSIVGVIISTVCIILHIIMFFLVEKLRNLPGYCLFSLCMALLIAYTCSFVQYKLSENADCTAIGMILLFSFLASFFWMNVISYDVWRSVRLATAKLRLSGDSPMFFRFAVYSSYAWGFPLLIVIISIIVDQFSTEIEYRLIFKVTTCWFQYKTALLIYFALPLFILLVMNVFFFIFSFYMIAKTRFKRSVSGNQTGSDLWSRLFLTLRLGSAMGLMWIFGVIATVTQREWVYYLYAVCNALQGVFIFCSFTVNDITKKACKRVIHSRKISAILMPSQQASSV